MEMKDLLEKTKITYSGSGYFWAEDPEKNKSHELFIYPLSDGKIKRSYESSLDPIPERFKKVVLGIYFFLVLFLLVKFGIGYGILASLPLIIGAIYIKNITSKKALFKAIDNNEIVVLIAKKDTKQAKLVRKIEEIQEQLGLLRDSIKFSNSDLFNDYVIIKYQINSFVRSAASVLRIAIERNIDGDPTATLEMIREADTIVNQLIDLRKADAEKELAIATQSKVSVDLQHMIDVYKSQTAAVRAIESGLDPISAISVGSVSSSEATSEAEVREMYTLGKASWELEKKKHDRLVQSKFNVDEMNAEQITAVKKYETIALEIKLWGEKQPFTILTKQGRSVAEILDIIVKAKFPQLASELDWPDYGLTSRKITYAGAYVRPSDIINSSGVIVIK